MGPVELSGKGRLAPLQPDVLARLEPEWDKLYQDVMAAYKKIPEHRRQLYSDNLILQVQISRGMNHWAMELDRAFDAAANGKLSQAQQHFANAVDIMQVVVEERQNSAYGKWENWYRGEYYLGGQHTAWALKPDWHVRDARKLAEAFANASDIVAEN